MAKKRISACWLLLLTAIFTASTLMGTGQAQARYQNTVTWNTVVDDTIDYDQVTSDCLENVSNPPVTILLGELGLTGNPMDVVFYLYSGVPVIGPLNWTTDQPDYVDVTMTVGSGENLQTLQPGDDVEIPEGTGGLKVTMTLTPTDKALEQSHEAMAVNVYVAWSDCLGGMFLSFLPELDMSALIPAYSDETVPDETVPDETVLDETVPAETVPEETVPEETVPDETVPEETTSQETQETEPAAASETDETEPAQQDTGSSEEPQQEEISSDSEVLNTLRTIQATLRPRTLASEAAAEREQQTLTESQEESLTDENTTDEGTSGESTNNQDTNNEGTNNEGTNNEGTNNEGTNNEGTNNEGTNNEGTGNEGTNGEGDGDETTDETETTQPISQDPEVTLETTQTFKTDDVLTVKIRTAGPMDSAELGMGFLDKGAGEMELISFPKYLRYSLDGGQSYYMFYTPGTIALSPTNGVDVYLLLDFSRVELASSQVNLAIAGFDGGESVAEDLVATTALEQYSVCAGSRILDTSEPLEIVIPQSWQGYTLEYEVQVLTSPLLADGSYGPQTYETVLSSEEEPAEEEPAEGESTEGESTEEETSEEEPSDPELIVEFTEQGNLQLRLGENLPQAGCYRIEMHWKSGETVAEQAQVLFYINYSVNKESLKTGGAVQ